MNKTPVGPKRSALTVFSLLHSSSLSNWSRSVNCDVGFFKELNLKIKLRKILKMVIVPFCNKETGCFERFVDYGNNIIVDDENQIAADALVFMLVSFRSSNSNRTNFCKIECTKG